MRCTVPARPHPQGNPVMHSSSTAQALREDLVKMGTQVRLCRPCTAALMEFLCLLCLLIPTSPGDQHWGEYSVQHPAAREAASPVANLTFDVMRKTLTWVYRTNVTSHNCSVSTALDQAMTTEPLPRVNSTWFCRFPNAVFHRGALLAVRGVMSDGREFEKVVQFRNSGKEGSGAVNFSCVIYHIRFMNCTWVPGPAAPADVRYHLYFRFSSLGGAGPAVSIPLRDDPDTECARYLPDSAGCHFPELGEPRATDTYSFRITGSSTREEVAFVDFAPFRVVMLEKYDPPANVSVFFQDSGPVVRWDNPPRRFDLAPSTFWYQLHIQSQGHVQEEALICQRGQERNDYLVPSTQAKAKHTVRLRVRHRHGHIWSEWSPVVHFGAEDSAPGPFLVSLVLAVLSPVALVALVLMVLCKRSSLWQNLCPPIPKVKGDVTQGFLPDHEVTWLEANLPESPLEPGEVLRVEETQ